MRKKLKKPVLAEGEVTGHLHFLDDSEAEVFEEDDGTKTFTLTKKTRVVHSEHRPITLETGKYVSDRVREYDPILESIRRIGD
jgi:hypothetical protein